MIHIYIHGKFETATRRGKATAIGNTVYVSIDNFREYANYQKFFAFKHDEEVKENNAKTVTTATYIRYVNVRTALNVRNSPGGNIVGILYNNDKVNVSETSGNWSRIGDSRWVCSDYLYSTQVNAQVSTKVERYSTGNYRVNASVLNVRFGPGTNYTAKRYYQLTANARQQNSRLGNRYCNGYKRNVICSITKINGNWGYTPSGWICLDYCSKI